MSSSKLACMQYQIDIQTLEFKGCKVEILMNESDLRSDVHYLGSSENKAWKKFRPVWDLNPWPLRYRVEILSYHLYHYYFQVDTYR